MALTYSEMLPLGTLAPEFELLDTVSGNKVNLKALKSEVATVIGFICNHCPYVKHLQTQLVEVANRYQAQGVKFIAISSNDIINYPADSPDEMSKTARKFNYPFPYLFDETQQVAKAYHATCTPDFFIFDHALRCVYRGRFDASSPGNDIPVTGDELSKALDCILQNRPIDFEQRPSMGCNIKWI